MEETNELTRKLEPVLGERARGLWLSAVLAKDRVSSRKTRSLTEILADKYAQIDYQPKIRLPPPSSDLMPGRFSLGTVLYPDEPFSKLGITDQDLLRHVLVVGMTGTGKTTLAFQLLRELNRNGIPFLIFDWKRSYGKLAKSAEFSGSKIIRLGDSDCKFRFNPLIPPHGINPKHWMALFIDVCKHAFFLGHGVEYFMRKAIDELYGRYRVYDGGARYPTFVELEKILVKEYVKGREMLWMSSAKRAVASLTFKGILREVFDTQDNSDMEELLNENVIIEMDNLANLEKTFVVEALILWLYHFKKAKGKSGSLNHVTVIEEAHHVLSSFKEKAAGEETIIESTLRMIREFGEGVVVLDQEPSKLSSSVIANTGTKVCFNLGHGKDIREMSEAMNLRFEESRMIDLLKIGHAVVKLKDRFPQPVHVRFPLSQA